MELNQIEWLAACHSRSRQAELHFDATIYPRGTKAQQLFSKTATWLDNIRENFDIDHLVAIRKILEDTLVRTIYGSNRIERAGLGWNATQYFCCHIFRRQAPLAWVYKDHDESDKDRILENILEVEANCQDQSRNMLLRARNEVIQHAKAYQHILHHFVEKEEEMSEGLIKETHTILTRGVPLEDHRHDDSVGNFIDDEYGGLYRDVVVGAGTTCFAHSKAIPNLMSNFCLNLKRDIETVEDIEHVDPFSLAAKYSMDFVQIHPFRDGNGRMCRIILNAILCRFAGVFCPIGEDDEDVRTYIGIKRREGETLHGHGEYALYVLGKAHTRVREMKKKLSGKKDK